jgi:hypothetical protein
MKSSESEFAGGRLRLSVAIGAEELSITLTIDDIVARAVLLTGRDLSEQTVRLERRIIFEIGRVSSLQCSPEIQARKAEGAEAKQVLPQVLYSSSTLVRPAVEFLFHTTARRKKS